MNIFYRLLLITVLIFLSFPGAAVQPRLEPLDQDGKRLYIIELNDPALVHFTGPDKLNAVGNTELKPTAPSVTGEKRLRANSPAAKAYHAYLDGRFQQFLSAAEPLAGERLQARIRYRNVMHGAAIRLTVAQAERLAKLPQIKSIRPNILERLDSDAGPSWLGAPAVWNGANGVPATEGEGVIVGIIDSGVNWDHPSFSDMAPDGFNHTNPLGQQLGLCSDSEVLCNDKLIGVYDFTDEETKGNDADGHGSNVASIAAGNRQTVTLSFAPGITPQTFTMSGVAPHANIVSYKVCRNDDPSTTDIDEDGCGIAEIIGAVDQAVQDGVDVVNFSIGGGQRDPWLGGFSGYARNFLDLREAGIFAAASNGNEGPIPGSTNYPAVAPWLVSIGAATHTRVLANVVQDMSGGGSPPPPDLIGVGFTNGLSKRDIVHAKDFGNALCGTGTPELQATCAANTGASNPFAPGTFTQNQIVVCDRGIYGRIEKGKNVQLAGAGGYILANTDETGESVREDEHCLPGVHLGDQAGDQLRAWLDNGSGHQGAISGFGLINSDSFADRLAGFSSRGPDPAAENVLKPNMIAPGLSIIGADSDSATSFSLLSGTSQATPHVAGSAALLKAVNPSWTPSQIQSALETTSTADQASDENGGEADPFERGTGRPQINPAARAGLFLDVTGNEFLNANPAIGGNPKNLNLPTLVDSNCKLSCSFSRTVTDMQGGGSWTVSVDSQADISVSPSSFSLANGGSQTLTFTVNTDDPDLVGGWVYGDVKLQSASAPDTKLTVAVFASGGTLPSEWNITTPFSSGSQEFSLNGLISIPDGTYVSAGLAAPVNTTQSLLEDPTPTEPFNGDGGNFIVLKNIPAGSLLFSTETLNSPAIDMDLFVGFDQDGDGGADEGELLCASQSADITEFCELINPQAGSYWVMVQNWAASSEGASDTVTLKSTILSDTANDTLQATGQGIVGPDESFNVRVSWDNVKILNGGEWVGAVTLGTDRDHPSNLGLIPVKLKRTALQEKSELLLPGSDTALVLGAGDVHEQMIIDVPQGANQLQISASASNASRNGDLKISLYRMPFTDLDQVFANTPQISTLPGSLNLEASQTGSGNTPPQVSLSGGALQPGRYYVAVENVSGTQLAVTVSPSLGFTGNRLEHHIGWWNTTRRVNGNSINQGFEFNIQGSNGFIVWYTYDESGLPTWYFAAAPIDAASNVWEADLLRLTNDGAKQQATVVGRMGLTTLGADEMIFSYRLFGETGSERVVPLAANTCPQVNSAPASYTGHWYPGFAGLGGSTVLVLANAQAQVHYLYDSRGNPYWVIASENGVGPLESEIDLLEFRGFCAVCTPVDTTRATVGTLTRSFDDESSGTQQLQFTLTAPLNDVVNRTFSAVKLSDLQACE